MKVRFASMTACAALLVAVPLAAQEAEADGELNLEAVDMLFGDRQVTTDETADAEIVDEDESEAEEGEDAAEDVAEAAEETEEDRQPNDLERALAGYEICVSEAGVGLAEQGFSPEQAGREALLRCGGQRAAYVNAFYFTLLPNYPDTPELQVRASAERLAAQTDNAIAMLVAREITEAVAAAPVEQQVVEEQASEEAPAEDEESE